MSLLNRVVLPVALFGLAVLAGCGGNSSTPPVPPPSGAFSNSNLNGTYVFSVSGTDVNGAAFAIVGNFTANGSGGNGNGGITGVIDVNDEDTTNFPNGPIPNSPIGSNSIYTVKVDGRGQMQLNTSTPFGTIVLDFVLQNSSHGLITEFDGDATGSGTIDAQTAGVTPNGSYAFSFSGVDETNQNALATVGNFTLGANGAITGIEDFNDGGFAIPGETLTGTVVLGPSSTPPTTLVTTQFTTRTYDVYAIDATHLKFIEMDLVAILSGDAFSQTSTTFPNSPLAFTLAGFFPFSTSVPVFAAAGGFIVTDGAGNIMATSTEDANLNGTVSPTLNFSGSYTGPGNGRFTLSFDPGFVGGTHYAAYPSVGGLLLLEIDSAGSGLLSGAANTQTSTTFAASQGYGLNLTGINLGAATGSAEEVDDIAEFVANSSGLTVTGKIDENFDPSGAPSGFGAIGLSGTYTAPDANGRGSIAATAGNNSVSTLNGGFALTFYTVDGTTFPFIETDNGQVAVGVFVEQNAAAASSKAAKSSSMFLVRPIVKPHAGAFVKK
jgi:hypothetical protein